MKPLLKITSVVMIFLTIVFTVLIFTTDHFKITFLIAFIFSMATLTILLTSSAFDEIIDESTEEKN